MNIRDKIIARRKDRIGKEGQTLGADVPAERSVPMVPFGRGPFIIAEIKRRSPSKGEIAPDLSASDQADLYVTSGIKTVSVLTEEDHFGGSLTDLMTVKKRFPETAFLRKDFLLDKEDISVSYRAGADAFLLIASALPSETLEAMYRYGIEMGITPLVEVHTAEDVAKVRPFRPRFVGINSRDLETFTVDPLHPIQTAGYIDWSAKLVFESGIWSYEDAVTPLQAGFSGLLVGESVVRNPKLIPELIRALNGEHDHHGIKASSPRRFWGRIGELLNTKQPGKNGARLPLIKICGITNRKDGKLAVSLGADMLGFVFADSPRRADPQLLTELQDLDVLKVAVVTGTDELESVRELAVRGLVDAVQFHGDENPEECFENFYPYYNAIRIKGEEDCKKSIRYGSPRVLFDAYVEDVQGGTGRQIDGSVLDRCTDRPLWLAGGLGTDNIREIIRRYSPELVDASSRLEASPGKKDKDKMERFFQEIRNG